MIYRYGNLSDDIISSGAEKSWRLMPSLPGLSHVMSLWKTLRRCAEFAGIHSDIMKTLRCDLLIEYIMSFVHSPIMLDLPNQVFVHIKGTSCMTVPTMARSNIVLRCGEVRIRYKCYGHSSVTFLSSPAITRRIVLPG